MKILWRAELDLDILIHKASDKIKDAVLLTVRVLTTLLINFVISKRYKIARKLFDTFINTTNK